MKVPVCKHCGKRLLRWGWYAEPTEPVLYWYCLSCDLWRDIRAGREAPLTAFIRVLPPGTEVG